MASCLLFKNLASWLNNLWGHLSQNSRKEGFVSDSFLKYLHVIKIRYFASICFLGSYPKFNVNFNCALYNILASSSCMNILQTCTLLIVQNFTTIKISSQILTNTIK